MYVSTDDLGPIGSGIAERIYWDLWDAPMRARTTDALSVRDEWEENKHPRDPIGQFTTGGGSGGAKKTGAKNKGSSKASTPKYDPAPVEKALASLKAAKASKAAKRSVARTEALREKTAAEQKKTAAEQKKAASAARKETQAKAPHVGVELIKGGVEQAWNAVKNLSPEEIKAAYKKSGLPNAYPREKDPQKMRANLVAAAVHQNQERAGAAEISSASKMSAEEVRRHYGGNTSSSHVEYVKGLNETIGKRDFDKLFAEIKKLPREEVNKIASEFVAHTPKSAPKRTSLERIHSRHQAVTELNKKNEWQRGKSVA